MSAVLDQVLANLQACEGLDPAFRRILATVPKPLTDADKIRRLRGALSGLIELIGSFEDVSLTRDLPKHQAEAIYDAEVQFAKDVMKDTA